MTPIKGYKGFDKDMKCRNFQYEVGKTYETKEAKLCEKGFHFCEYPIDIFSYYSPSDSQFAEVEGDGLVGNKSDDSKIACTKLTIKAKVSLFDIINVSVNFILDKVDWKTSKEATNTGDQSAATNTGYQSAATNTGDQSVATNTGYQSAASVEGKESIACGLGYENKAMGTLGCWIVLAERNSDGNIIVVKTVKVDGKKIKDKVWYTLKNKKFVKVKENK